MSPRCFTPKRSDRRTRRRTHALSSGKQVLFAMGAVLSPLRQRGGQLVGEGVAYLLGLRAFGGPCDVPIGSDKHGETIRLCWLDGAQVIAGFFKVGADKNVSPAAQGLIQPAATRQRLVWCPLAGKLMSARWPRVPDCYARHSARNASCHRTKPQGRAEDGTRGRKHRPLHERDPQHSAADA
jgi:hypothetical protein